MGMRHFDRQLQELQTQVFTRRHLKAELQNIEEQCKILRERVKELAEERQEELEDVERLEKHSLSSFFYKVTGKKAEKLDKERKEAYAAAVRYDAAVRELEWLEQHAKKCELQEAALTGCEAAYEACLKEKERMLTTAGGEASEHILELERKIGYAEQQEKEIREAQQAGKKAYATAEKLKAVLNNAEGWSTLDVLGGGILTDMKKYEELDQVQELAEQMQKELNSLKAELADVTVYANFQEPVDGFLRFVDYFFDGFFADMTVREQILLSGEQAEKILGQIHLVLARLNAQQSALEQDKEQLKKELEECIFQA